MRHEQISTSTGMARVRKALRIAIAAALFTTMASGVYAVQSPYAGGPYGIPGTVQAENYDYGLEGESYHDTSAGNVFGVYRTESMDVGAIAAGGYHIGFLAAGEWAEYTVNVATAGTYNLTYRYSSAYTGATSFRVLLNGSVLATRSVTSTGAWENYVTQTVQVSIPSTGSKTLMIAFDTGAFNLDWLQFALLTACTVPTVSDPPDKLNAVAGSDVKWPLTVSGSPAPTVRWFKGTLQTNIEIPTPTPLAFEIKGAEQARDAGTYFATATNSCGSDTSRLATLYLPCSAAGPDEMLENVSRALRGTGDYCEWRPMVRPGFADSFGGGGSYNIPVINNAVAFIRSPYGEPGYTWNMDTFWTKYLQGELGDRGQAWYFGGQELFSSDYEKYNMAAVIAVGYQAERRNNTVIRDLARRWLRATFALQGIGALLQQPSTLIANGQSLNVVAPYSGPYAALAGERTPWGFWTDAGRNVLMARALGLAYSGPNSVERSAQRNIRLYVEGAWPAFVPPAPCTPTVDFACNTNVYGLTSGEAMALRNAVSGNALPSGFVGTYLGTGLRTVMTYHIVAWPGVRASLLETNTHTSTAPTFGYADFGPNAYFLYPWPGVFTNDTSIYRNVCVGSAVLDLPGHQMWAEHPQCEGRPQPYQKEIFSGLPSEAPSYWVTLTSGSAPLVH